MDNSILAEILEEHDIDLYPSKIEKRFLSKIRRFRLKDQSFLRKTISYAKIKHKGYYRPENVPYVYHPILVATYCIDYGGSIDDVCACILHDILEDTDTNSSEIIELFGDVVCQKVKGVSKSFDGKKISIENYISKILEDKDLIRNKSCDIFANSHCTFFNLFEKEKQRYLDQWLNVYSPITNELKIYYPKLFDLIINSIKYSQAHTPSLIQRKRIEKLAQIRNSQNI